MSRRWQFQNAHSTKFLNYGHFGTTAYNEEYKVWETLRTIRPDASSAGDPGVRDGFHFAFPLRHLSSNVVYDGLAAPKRQTGSEANDSDVDEREEFTSGSAARRGFNVKTEDSSALIEQESPNRSALLAFGSAVSVAGRGQFPIVASVVGKNAQSVRLVRIGEEVINSTDPDGDNASVYVPYVSREDQTYWTSNGGPVQQVCFAATTGYPSTWMAARLQNSTTIFHPLLHREPLRPRHKAFQLTSQVMAASVLDANPIVTIPLSRTGGHPQADVCFHPQDYSRLALIDEHGNWSVWKVQGDRRESQHPTFRVSLTCSGKLWTWDHEKRLRASLPYHDGWHRISWCFTAGTQSDELFLCNRRTAAVYNTSGDLLGLKDLLLGHARDNQLILDLQWSKLIPGHCFVLTSTRLFWLHFLDKQFRGSGGQQDSPHVLLAWQHFRDRGDRTLNLILLETELTAVVLILSRLVDLVLVVRVGQVDGEKQISVSLADPLPIFLPDHPHHIISSRRAWSLLFREVESDREVEGNAGRGPLQLFKLFALYDNLSIVEHLYASCEPGFGLTAGASFSSILRLPIHISRRRLRSNSNNDEELGEFVVPDNSDEDDDYSRGMEGQQGFGDPQRQRPTVQERPSLDWQDIYAYLTHESRFSALKTQIKMDSLLGRLSDHWDEAKRSGMPLLSEIMPCQLYITDVDDESEHFEDVISTFNSEHNRGIKLERLPILASDGRKAGRLSSIYDGIITIHLTALQPQAPDRLRVNRERLARRVTAHLLLASTTICPCPTASTAAVNGETTREVATSQPSIQPPAGAPTASRSASTIDATASIAAPEDPILTRLRKYTTISPLSSAPLICSTNPIVSSILRHLSTSHDVDPRTYNWRATERTIAAEQEEQMAFAAVSADPRARKRAEKAKLARMRREESRRRAVEEIASSQRAPPKILSSSQLGNIGGGVGMARETGLRGEHGGREVQSSQLGATGWDGLAGSSQGQGQGHGMQMPMSQPERGLFGTRPGMLGVGPGTGRKRDKGKKRAAGF